MHLLGRPESVAGSTPTNAVTTVISTAAVTITQLDGGASFASRAPNGTGTASSSKSMAGPIAGGLSRCLSIFSLIMVNIPCRGYWRPCLARGRYHWFHTFPTKKEAKGTASHFKPVSQSRYVSTSSFTARSIFRKTIRVCATRGCRIKSSIDARFRSAPTILRRIHRRYHRGHTTKTHHPHLGTTPFAVKMDSARVQCIRVIKNLNLHFTMPITQAVIRVLPNFDTFLLGHVSRIYVQCIISHDVLVV